MSRIGEWLALHLFDRIPEGVPELEPEEDDEAEPMTQRLFHTTDATAEILAKGFRGEGVYLSKAPANVNEGATGDQVLEVLLPDDVDLSLYAIHEAGHEDWEWLVPTSLVNDRASLRLIRQEEVDDATGGWVSGLDPEDDDEGD